ncbi:MAG TPA: hypothetical protein VEI02_01215, partial [Planctomycetota bacterium]|nr:hypothetical protein [Planctomycetota bacterium]
LYLRFGRNADLEKSIRTGVRQLSTLKTDLVNLDATAQRISREKVQTVKDPGHPIGLLAANYQIADDVRIEKPVENRIAKSNYVETTVKFTFMKRSSYALFGTPGTNERGLLDFFNDIEKANPAIQIKEIDFGPRQPEDKSGKWEVRSATVRVLKPLKAGK